LGTRFLQRGRRFQSSVDFLTVFGVLTAKLAHYAPMDILIWLGATDRS
jgi:hypothetical protein